MEYNGDSDTSYGWRTLKNSWKVLEHLQIRGHVETMQTVAFLRSAKIVRRVVETWEDLLSRKRQWETTS